MRPNHSRKTFLARLAGLFAAIGLAPRLFAGGSASTRGDSAAPAEGAPFTIRPEARAVARRVDTV